MYTDNALILFVFAPIVIVSRLILIFGSVFDPPLFNSTRFGSDREEINQATEGKKLAVERKGGVSFRPRASTSPILDVPSDGKVLCCVGPPSGF